MKLIPTTVKVSMNLITLLISSKWKKSLSDPCVDHPELWYFDCTLEAQWSNVSVVLVGEVCVGDIDVWRFKVSNSRKFLNWHLNTS